MKIKRIQIRNFLGLKEVDISPKDVNIVNGRNRQGKTSLLKAIEAAFQSGDQTAKIRAGESSAEILIEMDDIYISRNIQLGDKMLLNVADTKTGDIITKPQGFLDSIVGGFSFNPAEFFMMDAKKQRQYILESLPMRLAPDDITEWTGRGIPNEFSAESFVDIHGLVLLQSIAKWYYDQRTAVNREKDRLLKAGQEQSKLVPSDFDLESYDPNGLQSLYEQVRQAENNNNRMATLESKSSDLNREILRLEKELKLRRAELDTVTAEYKDMRVMDVGDLEAQIAAHEEVRAVAQAAEKLIALRVDYAEQAKEAAELDEIVVYLKNDAVSALAERVEWPVPNMQVTDEGLTFDGKPFEMLSGAEQIQVALAIAKSLNRDFNIVCVDGVERLDEETFKEFVQQMEDDCETQYFITVVGDRVGKGAEIFTVEDGTILQKSKKSR